MITEFAVLLSTIGGADSAIVESINYPLNGNHFVRIEIVDLYPSDPRHIDVDRNLLPVGVREGDMLALGFVNGASRIIVDHEATEARRAALQARRDNLTATQRAMRYLNDPGHCPWCGHEGISGGQVNIDHDSCSQKVSCNSCDREWWDLYTLTGVEIDGAVYEPTNP